MSEPSEADRATAAGIVEAHTNSYYDTGAVDCDPDALAESIAAALAAERENERLQWNPIVGRVLQVTQEWHRSSDPRLRECAEQVHAAISNQP